MDATEGIDPKGELLEIMAGRGNFYRLLARVFAQAVDGEFLAALRGQEELLVALRELSQPGSEELKEFFGRAGEDGMDSMVQELAAEYASLFLGAGRANGHSPLQGGKSTAPYASAYLSADKSLMQEPYVKIRDFYRQAGLARTEESRELEDHASVTLEFLSRMADGTAEALAGGDLAGAREKLALQADFLDRYVLSWMPALCRDVARQDSTTFYRAFASITTSFLEMDRSVIDEVMEELEGLAKGTGGNAL